MSGPLRRTGGRNHSVFTCRRLEPEWFFQYEYVLASVSQSELYSWDSWFWSRWGNRNGELNGRQAPGRDICYRCNHVRGDLFSVWAATHLAAVCGIRLEIELVRRVSRRDCEGGRRHGTMAKLESVLDQVMKHLRGSESQLQSSIANTDAECSSGQLPA